jgi:isoaspartyl peptidase/L-asparaginase-like protein (Ntn-hydrolase superfamily)
MALEDKPDPSTPATGAVLNFERHLELDACVMESRLARAGPVGRIAAR